MVIDFLLVVLAVLIGTVVVPFMLFLSAKLVSYGWASGRHKFEQDSRQKGDGNGPSR